MSMRLRTRKKPIQVDYMADEEEDEEVPVKEEKPKPMPRGPAWGSIFDDDLQSVQSGIAAQPGRAEQHVGAFDSTIGPWQAPLGTELPEPSSLHSSFSRLQPMPSLHVSGSVQSLAQGTSLLLEQLARQAGSLETTASYAACQPLQRFMHSYNLQMVGCCFVHSDANRAHFCCCKTYSVSHCLSS